MSKSKWSEEEMRELIRQNAARAGSLRTLATEWGVEAGHLSRVLDGSRRPGPTVLDRLGLDQLVEVSYVRSWVKPSD